MKKQYSKIKILHHHLLFRLRTKKNRKQNKQTKNTHNKQCLAENLKLSLYLPEIQPTLSCSC